MKKNLVTGVLTAREQGPKQHLSNSNAGSELNFLAFPRLAHPCYVQSWTQSLENTKRRNTKYGHSLQILSISSRLLPFVSGTVALITASAPTAIPANRTYSPACPKLSWSVGMQRLTRKLLAKLVMVELTLKEFLMFRV